MLSSIHPLGERAKHNRFWVTAAAHVGGSAVGGLLLGAVLAGPAAVVGRWLPGAVALGAASVVCMVGGALAVSERRYGLPSWHRQVDERWLTTYRGWIYGFGYGAQLGFAAATIITSPLVHVAIALTVLSGSATSALLIGTAFGVTRGGTILLAAGITTPVRLMGFHRTFQRRGPAYNRVASTIVAGAGLVLLAQGMVG